MGIVIFGPAVETINLPDATLSLSALTGVCHILEIPEKNITLSGKTDSINTFSIGDAIIRYFLVITGAADGLDDIEIPMKSFQARRRTDASTYLSVVIPSVDRVSDVSARQNGTIRIEQGYEKNGEILQREVIIETDLDEVNYDQGGRNQSMNLVGYRQHTFNSKEITLSGAISRSMRSGKLRYRLSKPYIFLNPGDVVTIDSDTFTIDLMSYVISPSFASIELKAV